MWSGCVPAWESGRVVSRPGKVVGLRAGLGKWSGCEPAWESGRVV
jgi:hypothetical protein